VPEISPKKSSRALSHEKTAQRTNWKQIFLALSLVPLVAGVILIIMWAMDFFLWQPPDTQVTIAVLFIFLSFSASNFFQDKRLLAVGWFLLMIADGLLLSQLRGPGQILAIILGVIALGLFTFEVFRRVRSQITER
jgi:hypothetical protein